MISNGWSMTRDSVVPRDVLLEDEEAEEDDDDFDDDDDYYYEDDDVSTNTSSNRLLMIRERFDILIDISLHFFLLPFGHFVPTLTVNSSILVGSWPLDMIDDVAADVQDAQEVMMQNGGD
ncbi:hypothetical protein O3M35_000148 [Rhynocoris fuscipes]|uniref:Uncharacterized protein n=1 Tax=Rhynocoris fuscipes TaxID=488301 RepID=A0AAW1DMQ4_9HEMI